jgi:hypothetical protein
MRRIPAIQFYVKMRMDAHVKEEHGKKFLLTKAKEDAKPLFWRGSFRHQRRS